MLINSGPLIAHLRHDVEVLYSEAAPLLPITRKLSWVPIYGSDLAAIEPLMISAVNLCIAADESVTVLTPFLTSPRSTAQVGELLAQANPRLTAAHQALERAIWAQQQVPIDTLSPPLRDRFKRVTPYLSMLHDGIHVLRMAPRLLGLEGRRTYLLLALNQDELRAGGGFITAAGTISFEQGQYSNLRLENSSEIDRQEIYLYPPPPEAMTRYMDIPQWVFRDTNWSPDFPTNARTAMYFYRLGRSQAVDGVIAFDQTALQMLLEATGPVSIDTITEPIDPSNIIEHLRDARLPSPTAGLDWPIRKGTFLEQIAQAVLNKIEIMLAEQSPTALLHVLRRTLDERHVQIYLNDADAAALLAKYRWDGAIEPGRGDFLMVVDSNVGYNKATPKVHQRLVYDIDLRDLRTPQATITVQYTHLLAHPRGCKAPDRYANAVSYEELMTRCYATYLRVLVPSGIHLLATRTAPVPADWLLSRNDHDGGATLQQGASTTWELATFFVVPIGETREAVFHYRLPTSILVRDSIGWHYHLKIQKQAGTIKIPYVVNIRLPAGTTRIISSPAFVLRGDHLSFEGYLLTDQTISVDFR